MRKSRSGLLSYGLRGGCVFSAGHVRFRETQKRPHLSPRTATTRRLTSCRSHKAHVRTSLHVYLASVYIKYIQFKFIKCNYWGWGLAVWPLDLLRMQLLQRHYNYYYYCYCYCYCYCRLVACGGGLKLAARGGSADGPARPPRRPPSGPPGTFFGPWLLTFPTELP